MSGPFVTSCEVDASTMFDFAIAFKGMVIVEMFEKH
jgi:hypothetical protein